MSILGQDFLTWSKRAILINDDDMIFAGAGSGPKVPHHPFGSACKERCFISQDLLRDDTVNSGNFTRVLFLRNCCR